MNARRLRLRQTKITRRDLLRIGGSGMLGLTLGSMLRLEAAAKEGGGGGDAGWGSARSIIMCCLQGGPSHFCSWDPQKNVPDNVRSDFATIPTKRPGIRFTEVLPRLAQINDMDMIRIRAEDLKLRAEVYAVRPKRRARLHEVINASMPAIEKAVAEHNLDEYYDRALGLIISSRARDAFDLSQEPKDIRDMYGRNTYGQSCLLARRLVEAGTRMVEVLWPNVANSDRVGLTKRMKHHSGPMLGIGLSALIRDLDQRGLLDETLVVAVGEIGRNPQKGIRMFGNDNCYPAIMAGARVKRGYVHGQSDKTGSASLGDPVHPGQLLASIYHAFGIAPETIVYDHLNRPRELVRAEVVSASFA